MTETLCTHPDRDALLVSFLYDDIEPAERTAFGAHVAACGRCRGELEQLRGVRSTLSTWAPPELRTANHEPRATSDEPRAPSHEPPVASRWWRDIPAWAELAAAVLVLGASAGIANLDVHYDRSGLTVRTGWSKTPAPSSQVMAPAAGGVVQNVAAPWRADLTALEQQLRSEIRAVPSPRAIPAASVASSMTDAELRRRVGSILEASERRQQRELALRVAELVKDVNAQRQADLVKIDSSLGYIQRNAYGEAAKNRELINYLVKVSQTK